MGNSCRDGVLANVHAYAIAKADIGQKLLAKFWFSRSHLNYSRKREFLYSLSQW